jgi:hypothetical protein
MLARDFCYWLQGFFEITAGPNVAGVPLSPEKVTIIRNHLNLVFIHDIDPTIPGNPATLQAIHDGTPIGKVRPDGSTARC